MDWLEEQIALRKKRDMEAFEDSCLMIVGSVMGRRINAALHDEREQTTDAIREILKYLHLKPKDIPENFSSIDDFLERVFRSSGIMTREIILRKGWSKDAQGIMLGTFSSDGKPVALIPEGIRGYRYTDPETGLKKSVDKHAEELFDREAIFFYKPFPNEKMDIKELFCYIIGVTDVRAVEGYCAFGLAASLAGMLLPYLSKNLFSDVVPSGSSSALFAVAVFMVCASLGKMLFSMVQELYLKKISLNINMTLESATIMRILSLPSSFFKEYSAGDLAKRVSYVSQLASCLIDMGFAGFATVAFSLLYIFQIFFFAPAIASPALMVTFLVVVTDVASVVYSSKINARQMELNSKESGLAYSFVSGIEKIRLSGSERRAFAKWGKAYAAQAELLYNPPFFMKISSAVSLIIPLIGTVVIYYRAIKSGVPTGEYYAFNTAFGMMTGALTALEVIIPAASLVYPAFKTVRPIMEAVPEVSEDKPVIDKLSGGIELNNVSFRYKENMPPVLDNISLKIRPGQYVAITGKTGCGKSTLIRILLGFETPEKGAVYYDGKDLSKIDLRSLRRKIGVVMQNGQLFAGDIYSNIVISAPELSLDDAWRAASMAGLAEDIENMPMGMFTFIQEGSGGISGGQKQRLMIARAIAPKPKILIFDEATSALDNVTQKQVSDSLDSLHCTRIIVAHRLSTIKHCDRIIVLDEGRIVEDGGYDELIAKQGYFAELVKRQQVTTENEK